MDRTLTLTKDILDDTNNSIIAKVGTQVRLLDVDQELGILVEMMDGKSSFYVSTDEVAGL